MRHKKTQRVQHGSKDTAGAALVEVALSPNSSKVVFPPKKKFQNYNGPNMDGEVLGAGTCWTKPANSATLVPTTCSHAFGRPSSIVLPCNWCAKGYRKAIQQL